MTLYSESLSVLALPLALRTASANGTTVDRIQAGNAYENLLCITVSGTITDGTHALVVQESDNGTAWTNVPANQIVGNVPSLVAANSNAVSEFGISTTKRFVRVNTTVTGSPATGGMIGAVLVLGDPSYLPAR